MKLSGLLTTAASCLVVVATAQAQRIQTGRFHAPRVDQIGKSAIALPNLLTDNAQSGSSARLGHAVRKSDMPSLMSLGPGDSVGYTYYDLQTNASMPDRIINWPNASKPGGVVSSSMIWTASTDAPAASGNYPADSRGTYGAVNDGESWSPMRGSWSRIEDTRTGFCELDHLDDGRLVFASHSANKILVSVEIDAASNNFAQIEVPGSEEGLWVSMAVSGKNIHVIWTYTTGNANVNQISYAHSTDGGDNWSTPVFLTGPNSVAGANFPSGFGANSYAIAANGNNVAVWFLSSGVQLIQMRSDDNGATWPSSNAIIPFRGNFTRRYATGNENPDSLFHPDPAFGDTAVGFRSDTVASPGSSMDIMMREDGTVDGVVTMIPTYIRKYYLTGGDTTATTFAGGIIYQATYNYTNTGLLYISENGGTLTQSQIAQPGNFAYTGDPTLAPNYFVQRSYHGGYSLYPQLGMDPTTNNIFLTFTSGISSDTMSVKRQDTSTSKPYLFQHVFITYTKDGQTWGAPQDLTPAHVNCRYGSLANLVDDEVQIAYQATPNFGEFITDTLQSQPRLKSNVETLFLKTNAVAGVNGQDDQTGADASAITSLAPNPVTGPVSMTYQAAHNGNLSIKVVNALGEEVAAVLPEHHVFAGKYTLSFDVSKLVSGMYFVVLNEDGQMSTRTLSVVH